MSLISFRDGEYDERGVWQRTRLCHFDCGSSCTCKPPAGQYVQPGSIAALEDKGERVHVLKCLPGPFAVMKSRDKPFEVRQDDPTVNAGDVLFFREWNPNPERFTGEALSARVISKVGGGSLLIAERLALQPSRHGLFL